MYSTKIWKTYILRDFTTRNEIKKGESDPNSTIIYPPRELKLWPNTIKHPSTTKISRMHKFLSTGQEVVYHTLRFVNALSLR